MFRIPFFPLSWGVPLIPNHTSDTSEPPTVRPKLPLYGPLDIENYKQFLDERKKLFVDCYCDPLPNITPLEEFDFLYELAKGGFSKVLVVKSKRKRDESFYAMKIINKEFIIKNKCLGNILNEKRILQSMDYPFCVRLEYFCENNSNLYFILPFVSGGELYTHLSKVAKFQERISRFYAAQVVLALEYIHYCNVVYRDLKPENMLLDHLGFLKLTDFGLSKVVSTRTYTFCGTPEYLAPEIILGNGYGKSADWWAFGVLLFEMNSGHAPFYSKNNLKTYENITKMKYKMPNFFSHDLKDLVRRLLQANTSKRVGNLKEGSEEIKRHSWFRDVNWLDLLNRKVVPPFVPDNSIRISTLNFPSLAKVSVTTVSNASKDDECFKHF